MQTTTQTKILRSADLTPDGRYCYWIARTWDDQLPAVMFVGLNPGIVDYTKDDDTSVRQAVETARHNGFGAVFFLNLFASRADSWAELKKTKNYDGPYGMVGPRNNEYLQSFGNRAQEVVFCWGSSDLVKDRHLDLIQMFPDAKCLGRSAKGAPVPPFQIDLAKPFPLKPYRTKA